MIPTLYRRLERLEEQTIPMDEPKVWQIIILNSDGTQHSATESNGLRKAPRGKTGRAETLNGSSFRALLRFAR